MKYRFPLVIFLILVNSSLLFAQPNLTFDYANTIITINSTGVMATLVCINNGTTDSGPFWFDVHFSSEPSMTGKLWFSWTGGVGNLPPGNSASRSIGIGINPGSGRPPGIYYIVSMLDDGYTVSESNENDNFYHSQPIIIPYPVDITVTDVHVIDNDGPDIYYKLTVMNNGPDATPFGFKNRIYLSTDNIITETDYLINDWNVTQTLASGESKTSWDISSTVSSVPTGEYYLGVIADAKNDVWETNETNNTGYNKVTKVIIPEEGNGGGGGGTVTQGILEVPMAKSPPIIDGLMDAIWTSVGSVPLEKMNLTDEIAPEDWLDASALFKMMFDENNYYLFIETRDDISNISNAGSWENDSFEIYFDGDNSKNDQATGYDDNDVQLRYMVGETTEDTGHAPHSNCKFRDTDDGYNLEIRIPVQDMTFDLAPDHTFGFDIQMNDNDSGQRDHCLKWWSASNDSWLNAALLGTAHTTDYMAANPMIILQAPDTPVIDGSDEDEAWSGIPWISGNTYVTQKDGMPLESPFDIHHVNGWNDCRFNFKMMWQGGRLYFYAQVYDDIISTANVLNWLNDGFQIFLDGDNDKTESRNANDGEVNFMFGVEADGDMAFTETGTGWTIEARIFLTADFGIVPAIGSLMGLEVRLNDNDGSERDLWVQWSSADDMAWFNPSMMGTVQFAGPDGSTSSSDVATDESTSIQSFRLAQNFPNPFNPSTTIRYTVPRTSFVTLKVYDMLGREVCTLVHEARAAGEHSVKWDAQNESAGIYLLHMKAGEFTQTRKLIMQK